MILIQTHILCHTYQPGREESIAQICLALLSMLSLGEYIFLIIAKQIHRVVVF